MNLKAAGVLVEWREFAKDHTIEMEREWPLIRRWAADRLTPPALRP